MNKILVSPVAFNENLKIRNVIERFIRSRVFGRVDYLIVDDGSDDGTTETIQEFNSHNIKTIKHLQRSGVGAAIRTAVNFAVTHDYDILVIMAGNNKDNPEEIPLLVDPIIQGGYDLVQGSRYKTHGTAGGDMPFYRKVATKIHPWLFSMIAKKRITDSTNGFRAMRVSIFKDQRIQLNQEWLNAYELEPYILFKAVTLGYKVTEVPVTKIYPPKKLGYTKMRPLFGWWSILRPLVYLGLGIKQ